MVPERDSLRPTPRSSSPLDIWQFISCSLPQIRSLCYENNMNSKPHFSVLRLMCNYFFKTLNGLLLYLILVFIYCFSNVSSLTAVASRALFPRLPSGHAFLLLLIFWIRFALLSMRFIFLLSELLFCFSFCLLRYWFVMTLFSYFMTWRENRHFGKPYEILTQSRSSFKSYVVNYWLLFGK